MWAVFWAGVIWGLGPLSPFYALCAPPLLPPPRLLVQAVTGGSWMVLAPTRQCLAPCSLLRQPAPTRGKASGCWLAEMDCSAVMCLVTDCQYPKTSHILSGPFSLVKIEDKRCQNYAFHLPTCLKRLAFSFNLCPCQTFRLSTVLDRPHRP